MLSSIEINIAGELFSRFLFAIRSLSFSTSKSHTGKPDFMRLPHMDNIIHIDQLAKQHSMKGHGKEN